jgi:chromate transporter
MSSNPQPSLTQIFLSFAKMGAVLIGGGYALLPILEEEIVKKRGWAKSEEMADFYALAQLLPGVIALNTSMLVGQKLRGFKGNLASSLGLIFVPFILIAIYAVLYSSASDIPVIMKMLNGLRPAAAGMILGMGIRMFVKMSKQKYAILFAAAITAIVLFFNPPVIALILTALLAGIVWNAFSVRKATGQPSKPAI